VAFPPFLRELNCCSCITCSTFTTSQKSHFNWNIFFSGKTQRFFLEKGTALENRPSGNTITGIRKNHPGVTIKVMDLPWGGEERVDVFEKSPGELQRSLGPKVLGMSLI